MKSKIVGHVVSGEEIEATPDKVENIKDVANTKGPRFLKIFCGILW